MKKIALITIMALSSFSAFADHCQRYEKSPRYLKAIEILAKHQARTFEELCNHPALLEIEAQPSQIITKEGEVIPHVSVGLHYSYDSCVFMVNDEALTVTRGNCYSGY